MGITANEAVYTIRKHHSDSKEFQRKHLPVHTYFAEKKKKQTVTEAQLVSNID